MFGIKFLLVNDECRITPEIVAGEFKSLEISMKVSKISEVLWRIRKSQRREGYNVEYNHVNFGVMCLDNIISIIIVFYK